MVLVNVNMSFFFFFFSWWSNKTRDKDVKLNLLWLDNYKTCTGIFY